MSVFSAHLSFSLNRSGYHSPSNIPGLLHVDTPGGQVTLVANKNLDRDFAPVTFIDPLFDLLETAALRDVEHKEASR